MSHYKHLTIEDRENARVFYEQGKSLQFLVDKIGFSKSTWSREFRRNCDGKGNYVAHKAQQFANKRKKNCGAKPLILSDAELREYVEEKLELRWTPEQISGRIELEKKLNKISFKTIYRAIDKGTLSKHLEKLMRFKRRKKVKNDNGRGKIPNAVSIDERPLGAKNRSRYGHWESDTVHGKRGTGYFGTHVERRSGFLVAIKLENLRDKAFANGTVQAFEKVPKKLKKSFTADNGKEFAAHADIPRFTEMPVYFCDPYSAWQRGTNENTNGLLRQFYPKGASFSRVTDEDLQEKVYLLNNRPRKRHGFRTPREMLEKFLE